MLRNYSNTDNMSSIHNFKKGDIITRIKPSKRGDRSYMGDRLIFIGIVNEQIYYENTDGLASMIGSSSMSKLSLDEWSEGWVSYVNPLTLLNKITITGDGIK